MDGAARIPAGGLHVLRLRHFAEPTRTIAVDHARRRAPDHDDKIRVVGPRIAALASASGGGSRIWLPGDRRAGQGRWHRVDTGGVHCEPDGERHARRQCGLRGGGRSELLWACVTGLHALDRCAPERNVSDQLSNGFRLMVRLSCRRPDRRWPPEAGCRAFGRYGYCLQPWWSWLRAWPWRESRTRAVDETARITPVARNRSCGALSESGWHQGGPGQPVFVWFGWSDCSCAHGLYISSPLLWDAERSCVLRPCKV